MALFPDKISRFFSRADAFGEQLLVRFLGTPIKETPETIAAILQGARLKYLDMAGDSGLNQPLTAAVARALEAAAPSLETDPNALSSTANLIVTKLVRPSEEGAPRAFEDPEGILARGGYCYESTLVDESAVHLLYSGLPAQPAYTGDTRFVLLEGPGGEEGKYHAVLLVTAYDAVSGEEKRKDIIDSTNNIVCSWPRFTRGDDYEGTGINTVKPLVILPPVSLVWYPSKK